MAHMCKYLFPHMRDTGWVCSYWVGLKSLTCYTFEELAVNGIFLSTCLQIIKQLGTCCDMLWHSMWSHSLWCQCSIWELVSIPVALLCTQLHGDDLENAMREGQIFCIPLTTIGNEIDPFAPNLVQPWLLHIVGELTRCWKVLPLSIPHSILNA